MRKKILFPLLAILIAIMVIVSCNKTIRGTTDDLPANLPANQDLNAGTWKPVLLSAPTDIELAAPGSVSAPDYVAEINEIKSRQAKLTDADKQTIQYWSAGAVLRWNELLRELVMKYNLAPYQKPDGTYPGPDAANPLSYPYFPFANPPYAARAYAYVSAAQYDALIAAWHYKMEFQRAAPYRKDSSLQVLVPKNDLPSYPSEDAVIAAVSVEMLKLLFPGEQDFIRKKAEEHMLSRIQAGANVRSDIEAGELIGRQVAKLFVARARTDRASAAAGNPAVWKQMEDDAIARGEIPWKSLESPKRPPMLPLFGKVKPFLFDSLTVIALRPGPPPATASEEMKAETQEVFDITSKPTREDYRICHFWSDGIGTSTPPGHWDQIACADFIKEGYSEVRWARNLALLNMSLLDAAIVCWDTKFYYFNPRPSQMNPAIKTLTGVPNFPSYVSGHSTFSGAAATILSRLIPSRAAAYEALAQEAARSRLVGGLHYNKSDCGVGLTVGRNVGQYAVLRANIDGAD